MQDSPLKTGYLSKAPLHFCFVALLAFIFAGFLIKTYHDTLPKAYDDLPSFYWASQQAWQQQLSPYTKQSFSEVESQLQRKIYPYLYPPPSLLVLSPLALFTDYSYCKQLVTALNVLLWFLFGCYGLHYLSGYLQSSHSDNRGKGYIVIYGLPALCLVLFALYQPLHNTLATGQVNLLVLALLAPLFFQRNPSKFFAVAAGILLCLAITLKIYLLLLLIPCLFYRHFLIFNSCLISLAILSIISGLLFPQLWTDWINLRLPSGGYGQRMPGVLTVPWNQSINGFFIRAYLNDGILNGSHAIRPFIYLLNLSIFAGTCWVCWRLRYTDNQGFNDAFKYAIVLMLVCITLIAPLTWLHHLAFLLPAFWLLFTQALSYKRWLMLFCTALAFAPIAGPGLVNIIFPSLNQTPFSAEALTLPYNLFLSAQLLSSLLLFLTLLCLLHKSSTNSR